MKPMPDDPAPDWYHLDNLFPSRARLDEVHAPIVALALATLGGRGGDVLDLGCGNGALLAKLHAGDPGVVPHGVDLEPDRIEHARVLLPRFATNFVAADLYAAHPLVADDRHYALVLLAGRRLLQGTPDRVDRLKAWLAGHARHVLFYGYGTALTAFDSGLAGLARAAGLRLLDEGADVRASLVAAL
jgi:trans-aconitate methyltransferase